MKNLKLCQVRPGERFTLDGAEFVKLDEDRGVAFVVTADVILGEVPFDSERETERNNFVGSEIESALLEWLNGHPGIEEAVVERPIDLTSMDGMRDYGTPCIKVRLLTIDEYRRYREFIPLASEPYWTATPWTTERSPNSDSNNAYNVNTDGTLNNNNVNNPYFAARPALMEHAAAQKNRRRHALLEYGGCRVQVALRRTQRTIIKGGHILPWLP